jgi:hypothetical protein
MAPTITLGGLPRSLSLSANNLIAGLCCIADSAGMKSAFHFFVFKDKHYPGSKIDNEP